MDNNQYPPKDHPISAEKAKELVAGDLGDVQRSILKGCCAPIYWFRPDKENPAILNNGTITIIKTPKKLLGVTAAHVLEGYKKDSTAQKTRLQLMNVALDDILDRVIDTSDVLDLATIEIDESLLKKLEKEIIPLSAWPPRPPQEGKGIMLAGYPGADILKPQKLEADFGLFTALGISRAVNNQQITWAVDRENSVNNSKIKLLPPNHPLGGISGGPLIGWFESPNYISHYRLSGIISQASPLLENVIAKRADFIKEDGYISKPTTH